MSEREPRFQVEANVTMDSWYTLEIRATTPEEARRKAEDFMDELLYEGPEKKMELRGGRGDVVSWDQQSEETMYEVGEITSKET